MHPFSISHTFVRIKAQLKKIIKPLVPQSFFDWRQAQSIERQNKETLLNWQKQGCPLPPPHVVKQQAIRAYQEQYRCAVFIETGTYMGQMVAAQKLYFKKIYSIELAEPLFVQAQERFGSDAHITIMQGDSGKVLPKIMVQIKEPAIFWLDGHYSGGITAQGEKDCPIFDEIDAIFADKKYKHILLIDDARCFVGENDYPTIEELTAYVRTKDNTYQAEVKDDIIRYTPAE
ncbi:MAG: hypothetical protein ACFCUI_04525 [Bernardetiaceae bacterium]